jgi:hypothetical protein
MANIILNVVLAPDNGPTMAKKRNIRPLEKESVDIQPEMAELNESSSDSDNENDEQGLEGIFYPFYIEIVHQHWFYS